MIYRHWQPFFNGIFALTTILPLYIGVRQLFWGQYIINNITLLKPIYRLWHIFFKPFYLHDTAFCSHYIDSDRTLLKSMLFASVYMCLLFASILTCYEFALCCKVVYAIITTIYLCVWYLLVCCICLPQLRQNMYAFPICWCVTCICHNYANLFICLLFAAMLYAHAGVLKCFLLAGMLNVRCLSYMTHILQVRSLTARFTFPLNTKVSFVTLYVSVCSSIFEPIV